MTLHSCYAVTPIDYIRDESRHPAEHKGLLYIEMGPCIRQRHAQRWAAALACGLR